MRSVQLALALGAALAVPALSHATIYYVSPTGSDSAFGFTPFTPWKTIAKVNSVNLSPGDIVLFKRGGVWREMLQPKANNLTFGAYGTGNLPIITGADEVKSTWTAVSGNVCSTPLVTDDMTNTWINGVVGQQVNSAAAVLAPGQWFYDGSKLTMGLTGGCSSSALASQTIEVTKRPYALLLQNTGAIQVENLAFANGMYNTIYVGANMTSTQIFNNVTWKGAAYEGLMVTSGTPVITNSEGTYNSTGLSLSGGNGMTMTNSLLSGNTTDAIEIYGTNGASTIIGSTITGNSTEKPLYDTISNWSPQALTVSNSIILPNPYMPALQKFTGVTDDGTNVETSPMFKARATKFYIIPFIDDYINLGVAEQVAAVAKQYNCPISYALNTKLVTTADWQRVAALAQAGNEIVGHTRSHADLASNNVFQITYTGSATSATVSINQTTGLLTTYLNGSTTPDLTVPILDKWNSALNMCTTINQTPGYTCAIQGNQSYFTPLNLTEVTNANIQPSFMATANSNFLNWEINGAMQDIATNLPGYQVKTFATPFTSSNAGVEVAIKNAGFIANRNGTLDSNMLPNGEWGMSNIDIFNIAAEWLPSAYDASNPTGSMAAMLEALGAKGGVFAMYSHGYDEFTLAQWTTLFQNLKQMGGACTTLSGAASYIQTNGTLVPDGTGQRWSMQIPLTPDYANTSSSPAQGAHSLK